MEAVQSIKKEARHLARLAELRRRIYTPLAPLQVDFSPAPEPVPWEEHEALAYRPLPRKGRWADVFGCAWFRLRGHVPMQAAGRVVVAHIDIGGEGLVYRPGGDKLPVGAVTMDTSYIDRLQACTAKTILPVASPALGGETVAYDIDASFNGYYNHPAGHAYFRCAELCLCDEALLAFYYDYLTASSLLSCEQDAGRRADMEVLLEQSYRLGLGDPGRGRELLRVLLTGPGSSDLSFTAVGHSHLDLAWLWPLREGRRKAVRSFTHQVGNLERYPAYFYGASQAKQFQFVKESHPALFEKLRRLAAAGRLECQGAMWVEADANLPSGEALIRQILYGKRFFREELGQEMEICWLPDSFGFNGNLPQILKKSGVPYFLTTKLSWNEHNPFPYRSFLWEGIDGSRVLAHMPPGDTYNAAASPACAASAAANYPERGRSAHALMLYGIGDGGGGPGEAHLEMLLRQGSPRRGAPLRPGTALEFFRLLREEQERLPVYKGELYLEKHQGTYTSQAFNKRGNRRSEMGLQCLETLGVQAALRGGAYPRQALEQLWKRVLLLQFHDILPGSSIHRVYAESRREYALLLAELRQRQSAALASLSDRDPAALSAYNPAPYERTVFVKRHGRWFTGVLPPLGAAPLSPWRGTPPQAEEGCLKSERIELRFAEDGSIRSLIDRTSGFDYAGAGLNRLTLYDDPFSPYNAWDIDESYRQRPRELLCPEAVELTADGPLLVRRSHYRHGRTTIRQDIFLDPVYPLVYFRTVCRWEERLRMLRADFEPGVYADWVTCDIQLGAIRRSTREDTPRERAQFEICAQKYVDLSDGRHGLSLLNDGKYGHRVKSGSLSLNLLRSPVSPDPEADRGRQVFTYALLIHDGGCGPETVRQSYFLNRPVLCADGRLRLPGPARLSPENIVLETVKQAEDGQGLILRLYEATGQRTEAALRPAFSYRALWECDLEERPLAPAEADRLLFQPFEIKTLRFAVAEPAACLSTMPRR